MSKDLELYKAFIDGLVKRKQSVAAQWVKEGSFPKTEDNKAKRVEKAYFGSFIR